MDVKSKIDNILRSKGLTRQILSEIIDCSPTTINAMVNRVTPFSPKIKEQIIPILGISREEFEGWILAEKYPQEVIEIAVKVKKEHIIGSNKTIFATKLDEVLKEKELSRTALSKIIDYNQGGLNKIIIGHRTLSRENLEKLSRALNIPENELLAWRIADKYSLDVLNSALNTLNDTV